MVASQGILNSGLLVEQRRACRERRPEQLEATSAEIVPRFSPHLTEYSKISVVLI